ncbi:hypothetical protein HU200_006333 [Digitaria exilis]|uniref:F-box domain-containing protein n=1 Tax=Digitaria exilis TaxID=1010633 RepID=A0A835FRN0_9POAL|nr:hypothetical protein HU200_006333 [Digitaria exilis]
MAGLSSDPSWSDLPVDVLLCILDRLELPQALAFASVCTTWRSTAVAAGVPCCSGPWLMTWADLLEEREKQGRSSSAVTCNFYHLLDVGKAYGVTSPQGCFVACCGASHEWLKAVLSCSPSKGGDYVVMIIHRDNDWLSFVKSGQSKWQVASIIVGRDRYADCAYHYGRFYAVTFHGMVEQWDIDDLNGATRKVVVTAEIHMGPILSRHLLSTSWGDLLQVHAHLEVGYPDCIRFQIHKLRAKYGGTDVLAVTTTAAKDQPSVSYFHAMQLEMPKQGLRISQVFSCHAACQELVEHLCLGPV